MKLHFHIVKANSAFRIPSQTLQPPPPPPNKTVAALTCPSHIDSPPEGPNQFLLFWVALPAWTCSGHQRHSSIRPGWLWLIYPPNNQFVSLSRSFSSFSSLGSSSLCLLCAACRCAEYDEKVRAQTALTRRHVRVTTQSLSDLGEQLIRMSINLYSWHATCHFCENQQILHANKEP